MKNLEQGFYNIKMLTPMNNHYQKVVFFALSLLFLGACNQAEVEKKEVLRPVRYIEVGSSETKMQRVFSGFARVGSDVTLSFRTSGVIIEKNVVKGQSVKKGDLLGQLDNVEAQLAYEKALSELDRAESQMNTSETNFNRIKFLYEQGAKPLIEYENARNNYTSAKSQYETALRNRDLQKTQMDYGFIYAPMDGEVLKVNGDVNERVGAGFEFVVLNISDGRMKVIVNLPEVVINRTRLDMPVEINFPAVDGETFLGKVIEISPDISDESATYPVDVSIIDPAKEIRPGMVANVTFDFTDGNTANNRIILPVNTVGEDAGGKFVFVVIPENDKVATVQKRQVKIGTLTTDGFEITAGLKAGDKVVTAGLQTLLNGQKVGLQ
jgi:multidrug efflux system membrane fusion protein